MSNELFMILDLIAFILALLGNLAMVVVACVALVFAFKGIKIRKK
ncbi:MAG: hypothetical protein QF685_04670 [Verrucomicrobiota bacterium]|nr:hypothetical protein [Verrucomicrobiota bacterium]